MGFGRKLFGLACAGLVGVVTQACSASDARETGEPSPAETSEDKLACGMLLANGLDLFGKSIIPGHPNHCDGDLDFDRIGPTANSFQAAQVAGDNMCFHADECKVRLFGWQKWKPSYEYDFTVYSTKDKDLPPQFMVIDDHTVCDPRMKERAGTTTVDGEEVPVWGYRYRCNQYAGHLFLAAEAGIAIGLAVAGGAYAYGLYVASSTPAAAAVVAAEAGGAAAAASSASDGVSVVLENGIVTIDTGLHAASYSAEQLLADPAKWSALQNILFSAWEGTKAAGANPQMAQDFFYLMRQLGMITPELTKAAEPLMPMVTGG